MIDAAPPPQPPVVERPVAYQVSYGIVAGTASRGTDRVVVRVGGKVLGAVPVRRGRFSLQVELPPREVTVDVVAVGSDGARARARVRNVQGLPTASAPLARTTRLDPGLQSELRALSRGYPGSSAFYVVDLTTGRGAAWNAQAEFPGASSLKLAVAVTALAAVEGVPAPGSRLDTLLRRMVIASDNQAANEVEAWVGGSTYSGSRRVNAIMAALGLTHTDMYGGYLREPSAARGGRAPAPIPLRAEAPPSWGVGKRTTAYELGTLLRAVWLASGGRGSLNGTQPGFTSADARYLLYLLARVGGQGKLDRFLPRSPGLALLHKAGWIDAARHDNGLLVWEGGIVLVSVMTYRSSGVGTREDILAGRIAQRALAAFRG
jgi:Beta-lactamase enzyme family